MPKSAVAANSQAKVAAMIVRSELLGTPAVPARYTNSCWSMIGTDNAVKVGGRYEPRGGPQGGPGDGRITAVETIISKPGESAEQRRAAQAENMDLYRDFTADVFG